MDIRDLEGTPVAVIIGGGLAGLMTALQLAPEPVVLLSKAPLGDDAASAWRRAASPPASARTTIRRLQVADTLAAGDGLCDAPVVERIIARRRPRRSTICCGSACRFDRDADGRSRARPRSRA